MFIAALFTIAKTWKQSKYTLKNEWIKKMWYICNMEYYSTMVKKKILPFAKWVALKGIMLSEISQTDHVIPYYEFIKKRQTCEVMLIK